jgi:hypothetical protein
MRQTLDLADDQPRPVDRRDPRRPHPRRGPATGGDVRRLADLFGLSIRAGTGYTNVLSHPDLSGNDQS